MIPRQIPDPHAGLNKFVQLKNDLRPTSGDNRPVFKPEIEEIANDIEKLGASRERTEKRYQAVLLESLGRRRVSSDVGVR